MFYYVRVFSVSPYHQNLQKLSHNCRILHLHERALPVFLNGDETFVLSNKQSFFLITNFLHVDSRKYWALRVGLAFPRRVTPTVASGRPRPERHPGRRPHARWAAAALGGPASPRPADRSPLLFPPLGPRRQDPEVQCLLLADGKHPAHQSHVVVLPGGGGGGTNAISFVGALRIPVSTRAREALRKGRLRLLGARAAPWIAWLRKGRRGSRAAGGRSPEQLGRRARPGSHWPRCV